MNSVRTEKTVLLNESYVCTTSNFSKDKVNDHIDLRITGAKSIEQSKIQSENRE